jgi:trans-aconitate methyltransferase
MHPNWQKIWNNRVAPTSSHLSLEDLLILNGYDTGAGHVPVADFRGNAQEVCNRLQLREGDSVYDVGCGAGAFLMALREVVDIRVGGIDYSKNLIAAARRALPESEFKAVDAAALETTPRFDWVVSHGVFHYFELAYADTVLNLMLLKAIKGVAIFELPDKSVYEASEKMRRAKLSPDQYESKYAGLKHTYFDRSWFSGKAAELGAKCEIFQSFIPNSSQSNFRFNCIINLF